MSAKQDVSIEPSDKIADDVKSLLSEQEMVPVLVYMNTKFDSQEFALQARQNYSSQLNSYETTLAVRRDLVNNLRAHSQQSQRNVLQLLSNNPSEVAEYEGFHIANVVYVKATPAVIEQLAQLPEVRAIEKEKVIYQDQPIESEDVAPAQDDDLLWHLQMVKADQVWGLGIDGQGVVVANIDSGVDWTHPALTTSWRGYREDGNHVPAGSWFDAVAGTEYPVDSDRHGTHVMGTMVGRDPETGYTVGVAPGAKWIAVRVFDPQGSTTDSRLLRAAEWILAPNGNANLAPDVVNNSWGGGSARDDWYIESVENWVAAEIFPTFSAGNQRTGEPLPQPGSISNPSHYVKSYAVAAIDRNMVRASWSKRGPSPYEGAGWKPNISAPGVGVMSSVPGGNYASNSGTSMSAPHVSGVVALMRSANAGVTVEDMIEVFSQTALPLTDNDPNALTSPNHDYGYGLIDAMESVLRVAGGSGTFTGRVLQAGSDAGPPTLVHTQPAEEIYQGSTVTIDAEARDDISVVDVKLLVHPGIGSTWLENPMRQVDGDHTGGNYTANITPEMMLSDKIQYKIRVTDFAGNVVESETYSIDIIFGVVPGETIESFESGAPGWTMQSPWMIGTPSDPNEPAPIDGDKLVGTSIGGLYPANSNAYLISAPIDMRNATEASLRFFHWHQFGGTNLLSDYGRLYLTNDYGETMTEVATYVGDTGEWKGVVVDLSDYANSPTPVFAVFRFISNSFSNYLGWYIDQVSVEGPDTTAPAAPTNLKAAPGLSGINLTWDRSPEPDVHLYEVFRSTQEGELGEYLISTAFNRHTDEEDLLDDTTYYYTVKALDLSGNLSDPSNQASSKKGAATVMRTYNFEDSDGGFTTGSVATNNTTDWAWGDAVATHGPRAAHSGTKFWATGLGANYSPSAKAYLQSPSIELPATGSIYLRFMHWHDFEIGSAGTKYDFAKIQINVTGDDAAANWIDITPGTDKKIGGASNVWLQETINLSEYAGQTARIRFHYESDSSVNRAGWFIDDVEFVHVPVASDMITDNVVETSQVLNTNEVTSLDMSALFDQVETEDIQLADIPVLDATVSVVETGLTVRTDPRTGAYRIRHKVSEDGEPWTLKAAAYGFKPAYFSSELEEGHTVEHTFVLQPEDSGSIRGRVYDRYYNNPAAGAVVRILEDPNVAPVVADEDGNFAFPSVYVGEYTLYASAEGFESGTAKVTVVANEEAVVDIPLKRFVGIPGQIIYDDDSAENALVLNAAGNGLATLFTPDGYGKLLSADFFIYNDSWPTPGGNELGFGVFVKEGNKVTQIGETIVRSDLVRGEWNRIDFSDYAFSTDGDFFISTIQTKIGTESPGLGIDEAGPTERGFIYAGGDFINLAQENITGVPMIRATMEYAAETPIITNLDAENYVNTDTVYVEGTTTATEADVLIYVNDKLAATVKAEDIEDGVFGAEVALDQEVNTIRASLKVGTTETEPSEELTVIKDQIAPEVEVTTPADQARVNVELIHVNGTAQDKYFDRLLVNGEPVTVDENNVFTTKVIVEAGENTITVEAYDKAGNRTEVVRTVYVDLGGETAITDMLPAEDVTLKAGESVEVAFSASPGGQASYRITLPITIDSQLQEANMVEGPAGRYKATWTAPADLQLNRADVQFQFTDAHGNTVGAVAPGKITVVVEPTQPVEPEVTRVKGENRYDTAVQMSKTTFESADTVIIASGENFPDALVGGIYAEKLAAPVLLTMKNDLPAVALAEIDRLGATKAIVLGGTAAIEETVVNKLKAADLSVERVAGANRFLTAELISQKARAADSTHVYLVNGYNFPDALSIVPVAAMQDHPILLSATDKVAESTMARLAEWNTKTITLVGGGKVLSPAVETQLTDAGYAVRRLSGETLYHTNIKVAVDYFDHVTEIVVASGKNYPDALVSTVYAAMNQAPIILVNNDGLSPVTVGFIRANPIEKVTIMGGNAVISAETEQAIIDLIK